MNVGSAQAGPTHADAASHASRIAFLDGWRGIAILLVLISHFGGPVALGALGVHAFFVLSGLLTARVLFIDRMPLRKFYRRRIARILPALYTFLLIVYVAAWALGRMESPAEVLATMFFLRSYVPVGSDGWLNDLPLAHLWSLNVEEHAYVALSLVAFLSVRGLRSASVALAGVAMACVVAYAWHRFRPPATSGTFFPTRTECAAFSIMLSASVFLLRTKYGIAPPRWLSVVCLTVVALGVTLLSSKLTVQFIAVPAVLAVAINSIDSGSPWLRRALEARWLGQLGKCSFSIYLWQQPAHFLLLHDRLPFDPMLAGLLSVGIGALFFALVEKPARRWINGQAYRSSGNPLAPET